MQDNVCLFTVPETAGTVWELTYRCNYGCLHCCNKSEDVAKHRANELNTAEVKRGISDLVDHGVASLYLSGGDPLMREDFLEILEHARNGVGRDNIFFATNGHKITHDIAQEIGRIGVGSGLISLDGHTPEIAERFRPVKDNYHIALRAINMLKGEGVPVTMGTVLWRDTYLHAEELIRIGVDNGVDTIFFSWLVPVGRAEENSHIAVPWTEYLSTGKQLRELRERYSDRVRIRFRRFECFGDGSKDCPGGTHNYHIIPDGRLSVCSWAYKHDPSIISQRSIRDTPFEELVRDESIIGFTKMVEERRSRGLGPGCPVLCSIDAGTYYAQDPLYKKG